MSWVLTFIGFVALIVLHELGHFLAAKAVGMRVERFAIFFPPLLLKTRRGETEYGIGAIPLGGYVKVTGMNPREELAPEVAARGYLNQPVWKRIVVIAAGPAVNVLVAFLILWALFSTLPVPEPTTSVAREALRPPASGFLKPGDRVVSVDGRGGSPEVIRRQIARHRCPGQQTDGCQAATPARVVVERDGRLRTFEVRPRYDSEQRRPLLGFAFEARPVELNAVQGARIAVVQMWELSVATVSKILQLYDPEERKDISGIVGSSKVLSDSFQLDIYRALTILGFISLSLALVNMFPFLPLDGGHIFWAVAEKVRGKRIPYEVMERSMAVGFVLVILLFVIGLSNDINRLQGEGFGPR